MKASRQGAKTQSKGKWKPYPAYKDSGIEWLGEVPAEWKVKKIKHVTQLLNGYAFDSKIYVDEGIPIIRIGDVSSTIDWAVVKRVPLDLLPTLDRFRVNRGDILLAMTGATIGKTAVYDSDEVALLNQRVGIIRATAINQQYLSYFVQSDYYKAKIYDLSYGGAQENIGRDDLATIFFPIPAHQQQCSVAVFLDRETARIDSLIEKKQRQIELLQEKRAALISHAVTKGLDPNAKMKDSGVEWLGEVPEHWEVKRLKFVARTIMGQSPSSDSYTFNDSCKPFLQGNAEFGLIHPFPKYYCDIAAKEVPKGSLLISVRAPVGALNIADQPYGIGRGLCAVVTNGKSLLSDFAWYALTVTRNELWSIATGSTYEAVSADEVAAMILIIPSLNEQRAIAAYLDRETERIDSLIEKVKGSIEKLREYRTALISAAVTGKIDVREV